MKAIALVALALGSPAGAEVVSASSNGFEVRETSVNGFYFDGLRRASIGLLIGFGFVPTLTTNTT